MGQRERRAWRRGRCAAAWLCALSLTLAACRARSAHRAGTAPPPAASEVAADSAGPVPPCRTALVSFEAVPLEQPLRLRNRRDLEPWDLSLQEAIFVALSHAEVIRQNGQFFSPTNTLLRSPEGLPSVHDPALQESGVLFGQRGGSRRPCRTSTRSSPRGRSGETASRFRTIRSSPEGCRPARPWTKTPLSSRRRWTRHSPPGDGSASATTGTTPPTTPSVAFSPRRTKGTSARSSGSRCWREGGSSSRGSRGPSRTTSRG